MHVDASTPCVDIPPENMSLSKDEHILRIKKHIAELTLMELTNSTDPLAGFKLGDSQPGTFASSLILGISEGLRLFLQSDEGVRRHIQSSKKSLLQIVGINAFAAHPSPFIKELTKSVGVVIESTPLLISTNFETIADNGKNSPTHVHKKPCLLAVATEWDSRNGGISSFNRDFCCALADAGTDVYCAVKEATDDEIRRAFDKNVNLILHSKLTSDFSPDVVIGHDRISGPLSVDVIKKYYMESKRTLFIHTLPEEIEEYKEDRPGSSFARGEERKLEQLALANECELVVTVGPHLKKEFGTDLQGVANSVSVIEMTPGFPETPTPTLGTIPSSIRCLIFGRVDDYILKGLDLAAKAIGRVVATWKHGDPAPILIVRGVPEGKGEALRQRLSLDTHPTPVDIRVREYSSNIQLIQNDLREASLVLMPSLREGFGLAGLEAIASGIPILISDQSGLAMTLRELAGTNANQWILPVKGAEVETKWVERIAFFLENRTAAFAQVAELREALSIKLDWQRSVKEFLLKLNLIGQ